MEITINVSDGVPIYRQIANQVRYLVASGLLRAGEEIPSIRTLALRPKVTPNTVVKAYDELESAGILEKRHGAGTFFAGRRASLAKRGLGRIIEPRIDALLAEAQQLGYTRTAAGDVRLGAQRDTDPDLAPSLRDGEGHDRVDAREREEQGLSRSRGGGGAETRKRRAAAQAPRLRPVA